jgi:hypothetical protein
MDVEACCASLGSNIVDIVDSSLGKNIASTL